MAHQGKDPTMKDPTMKEMMETLRNLEKMAKRADGDVSDDDDADYVPRVRGPDPPAGASERMSLALVPAKFESESLDVTIAEDLVGWAQGRMGVLVASPGAWRTKSKLMAKCVARIVLAINCDWSADVGHRTTGTDVGHKTTRVLVTLAQMVVPFAQDPHASWISGPILRLFHCVLLRVAADALARGNGLEREHRKIIRKGVQDCEELLNSTRGPSVGIQLARETLRSLEDFLSEWKSEAVKAAGTLVVGAVKSIATMKVDEGLIKGLSRGVTAGHGYFKQLQGQQRLELLCQISVSMSGIGDNPVVKDLVSLTAKVKRSEGNWIVETSWIFELHRTASRAVDLIQACGSQLDEKVDKQVRKELLDCLQAALGDRNDVKGLTRFVTSARTPMQPGSKAFYLVGALLDGESLLSCGRAAADELMGEIEESIRIGWMAKTAKFSRDIEVWLEDNEGVEKKDIEAVKKSVEKIRTQAAPALEVLQGMLADTIRHLRIAEDHTRNMSVTMQSAYGYHVLLGMQASELMPSDASECSGRKNFCTREKRCQFCRCWSEARTRCDDPLEFLNVGMSSLSALVSAEITDALWSEDKSEALALVCSSVFDKIPDALTLLHELQDCADEKDRIGRHEKILEYWKSTKVEKGTLSFVQGKIDDIKKAVSKVEDQKSLKDFLSQVKPDGWTELETALDKFKEVEPAVRFAAASWRLTTVNGVQIEPAAAPKPEQKAAEWRISLVKAQHLPRLVCEHDGLVEVGLNAYFTVTIFGSGEDENQKTEMVTKTFSMEASPQIDECFEIPEGGKTVQIAMYNFDNAAGLKWRKVGKVKPSQGRELKKEELAEELASKLKKLQDKKMDNKIEFTPEEAKTMNVLNVRPDDFIAVGPLPLYYRPEGTLVGQSEVMRFITEGAEGTSKTLDLGEHDIKFTCSKGIVSNERLRSVKGHLETLLEKNRKTLLEEDPAKLQKVEQELQKVERHQKRLRHRLGRAFQGAIQQALDDRQAQGTVGPFMLASTEDTSRLHDLDFWSGKQDLEVKATIDNTSRYLDSSFNRTWEQRLNAELLKRQLPAFREGSFECSKLEGKEKGHLWGYKSYSGEVKGKLPGHHFYTYYTDLDNKILNEDGLKDDEELNYTDGDILNEILSDEKIYIVYWNSYAGKRLKDDEELKELKGHHFSPTAYHGRGPHALHPSQSESQKSLASQLKIIVESSMSETSQVEPSQFPESKELWAYLAGIQRSFASLRSAQRVAKLAFECFDRVRNENREADDHQGRRRPKDWVEEMEAEGLQGGSMNKIVVLLGNIAQTLSSISFHGMNKEEVECIFGRLTALMKKAQAVPQAPFEIGKLKTRAGEAADLLGLLDKPQKELFDHLNQPQAEALVLDKLKQDFLKQIREVRSKIFLIGLHDELQADFSSANKYLSSQAPSKLDEFIVQRLADYTLADKRREAGSRARKLLPPSHFEAAYVAFISCHVASNDLHDTADCLRVLRNELQGIVDLAKQVSELLTQRRPRTGAMTLLQRTDKIKEEKDIRQSLDKIKGILRGLKPGSQKLENLAARHDQMTGASIGGSVQAAGRVCSALGTVMAKVAERFDGSLPEMGDVTSLLEDVFDFEKLKQEAHKIWSDTNKKIEKFSSDLFNQAEDTADSLTTNWAFLSTSFKMFDCDSSARQAVREVLQGTLGPPPRPELVEEAAIAAILDLKPRIQALDDPSLERLQRKLESTIASVRASAASEGVRILLAQDKYRSMVQKAVEDNWKFLKNDIKGSIKSQNVVQEQLMKKLEGHEPGEFENREDVLKQNYLTAADRINIQQEEKIKARLSSLTAAQQDITGGGAGAAGHGVELETWIFQSQVQTEGNSAHINDHLCRLDPYRFYRPPGGDKVTNYHYKYSLYNHVHTNQDVLIGGVAPTHRVTSARSRNVHIYNASNLDLISDIERFVGQVSQDAEFYSRTEIVNTIAQHIKRQKDRITCETLTDCASKVGPPSQLQPGAEEDVEDLIRSMRKEADTVRMLISELDHKVHDVMQAGADRQAEALAAELETQRKINDELMVTMGQKFIDSPFALNLPVETDPLRQSIGSMSGRRPAAAALRPPPAGHSWTRFGKRLNSTDSSRSMPLADARVVARTSFNSSLTRSSPLTRSPSLPNSTSISPALRELGLAVVNGSITHNTVLQIVVEISTTARKPYDDAAKYLKIYRLFVTFLRQQLSNIHPYTICRKKESGSKDAKDVIPRPGPFEITVEWTASDCIKSVLLFSKLQEKMFPNVGILAKQLRDILKQDGEKFVTAESEG